MTLADENGQSKRCLHLLQIYFDGDVLREVYDAGNPLYFQAVNALSENSSHGLPNTRGEE